jgi:magnesium-transporting ATPase (P-type)
MRSEKPFYILGSVSIEERFTTPPISTAKGEKPMKTSTKSWREKIYVLTMVGCIQFVVLTLIAMVLYPGGTHADPTTKGYSFFRNFFSDLGLTETISGDPKFASFLLFTVAMVLAGAALVIFFIAFPKFFSFSPSGKGFSIFGSIAGTVSGLAFIGVALPGNLYPQPHTLSVQIAFLAFFVAVLFYIPALFLKRDYPRIGAWTFVAFAILLGVYIWLLFEGPSASTSAGLIIQATGQKIIVYAAIVSMFIQSYSAWKTTKGEKMMT